MNKIFLILFLIFFSSLVFSLKVEPFVSFPGEKVSIEFDSKISLIEMKYYYNLNEVQECKIFKNKTSNCPLFENNSLEDSGKKKFELNVADSKPGFYAVKIFEEEDENKFYFTSIVVRPDYRPLLAFIVFLLIVLLIAVEKNVFGR